MNFVLVLGATSTAPSVLVASSNGNTDEHETVAVHSVPLVSLTGNADEQDTVAVPSVPDNTSSDIVREAVCSTFGSQGIFQLLEAIEPTSGVQPPADVATPSMATQQDSRATEGGENLPTAHREGDEVCPLLKEKGRRKNSRNWG